MTEILRFWRDKTKEEKSEIKSEHNIKVVSYDFIEKRYLESIHITDNFRDTEKD